MLRAENLVESRHTQGFSNTGKVDMKRMEGKWVAEKGRWGD